MNHLLIGLGGTGGKVLAAIRRQVFQQYRSAEPDDLALDYLYIDSSEEEAAIANVTARLQDGDQVWRTLGHSVQLAPSQIVLLKQGDLGHILANIDDFETLRRWIGDRAIWRSIMAGAPNGITAAGQIRRFGRLLLAQNVQAVQQALRARVSKPSTGAVDSSWTFHIVAGLAGGTGSGTLIDMIGQIRKLAQGASGKIIVYAVLPESEDTSWAKDNYYANGYAALAELNAMIVGRFRPADLAETAGDYDYAKAIDNVFVVTNSNDSGISINVNSALPNVIAETIYQIVVVSGDARALGSRTGTVAGLDQRVWRKMVTGENYTGEYEKDIPVKEAPEDRANRFLSFGINRVAIPTQEIREYSAAVFLRQFLLQSLNNQWVEGVGFAETRGAFDGAAVARADENRTRWCLTNAHLKLETKTLQNDKDRWTSLGNEFRSGLTGKMTAILNTSKNSDDWARQLEEFAREFYDRSFRAVGVAEFYRVAERSIADRARYIVRDRVAGNLFDGWAAGNESVNNIIRVIDELIVDVTERMAGCDKRIQEESAVEADKERLRKQLIDDYHNKGKLSLSNLWHSRRDKLSAISSALAEVYAARGGKIAYAYAQKTLGQVLSQLQELKADVEVVANRLAIALETVERRRADRVRTGENAGWGTGHYKLFDPEHIRGLLRRLEQTEQLQRSQTADLRGRLLEQLGVNRSFSALVENVSEGRLVALLEGEAEDRAEATLAQLESERDRILEASVIQKLYDQYSGRESELQAFLGEQVRRAGTFAKLDANERIAFGVGDIERCVVAFVPAAGELRENLRDFHATLVRMVREAASGLPVEVVETSGREHEIVFLSLVNQFALRHLDATKKLRAKHERLVSGPQAERKRLELYIQGDGTDLPGLFAEGITTLREKLRPHWLVATMTDLISERRNSGSGATETILLVTDSAGFEKPVKVGDAIADGPGKLDMQGALHLREAVKAKLGGMRHIDDRTALVGKLAGYQNDILRQHDYDQDHPLVVAVMADVAAARGLIDA